MSKNRKLVRAVQNFYQQFKRKPPSTVKEQSLWLLRSFIVTKKRPEWVNAGFVLPTVAMVSLVVVLLTIAILFRSFDRSKNASNVRVNQAVLNAATPAIDRARAKIDKLFNDPRLPRSTPNDFSLDQVISQNLNEFTFGDESQLTLFSDIDNSDNLNTSPASLTDQEHIKTAWKYPVDTDNNGKFDSYTLYSINFRNPPQTNGNPTRVRNPLEARTPPMNETNGSNVCDRGNNTSAQLVGSQGWYQRGAVLRRSLFVYTTTVPITGDVTALGSKYETFKGNKGFAALEYQQDRERRPLTNNAVLYNDDLEISPGGGINLNGRIQTNSNLFAARRFNPTIRFFLVSSPDSCYFSERNSKIVVGGNVANARISDATDQRDVTVDLFQQINAGQNPSTQNISSTNKTIDLNGGTQIAYNSGAYERRLVLLIDAAAALPNASLPTEVKDELQKRVAQGKNSNVEKRALLRSYFRKRTRRIPYAEVTLANTNTDSAVFGSYTTANVLQGSGDSMRPPDVWVFPFASDGITHTGYANLQLKTNGNNVYLSAQPTDYPEPKGEEQYLGDRVVVGNNLPQTWWDATKNKFVTQEEAGREIGQTTNTKRWNGSSITRKRYPQVSELDDLGQTDRDRFWEENAAIYPKDALDVVGGLRVVTGAGIYLPKGYSATESATTYNAALTATDKVWSDQMAVPETPPPVPRPNPTVPDSELPYSGTAYLQMRATAVYHFQRSAYDPNTPSTNPQTPIACISSFYNPTNATTARNINTLPNFPDTTDRMNRGAGGLSNNGIVYGSPTRNKSSYQAALDYQASLKYPDGRFVHKELRNALAKGTGNLTLSEKSTLDSAICALQIMDASIAPSNAIIPHGAIKETSFLDARQVKAVDRPAAASATTYDLDVELRQPLEIRATVLDMAMLKNTSVGTTTHSTTEYLLPNSGIIYATRDDALPDLSGDPDPNDNNDTVEASANDFVLDPTRRPNGIMLINGQQLNRTTANLNRPEEKGLILVSNLPVYIKGDFNQHQREEFTNTLNATWSNFYDRTQATLDPNFACRTNQFTGCTTGETWRPATVIADAITVLSPGFQEGFRNQGDYNLRDNWGYAPQGYDLNGNGTIETTTISLDERILRIDLNGNNNMTDSSVTTMDERALGVDLNDNGNKTDTAVPITEQNIPSILTSRFNGFWDNNFVTSFPWQDNVNAGGTGFGFPATLDTAPAPIQSSYFNNFATPIQRRASFPEYVMEICRRPTVTACRPNDWSVGYAATVATAPTLSVINWNFKAIDAVDLTNFPLIQRIQPNNTSFTASQLGAGTTARPALNVNDRHYPRRIAFLRRANGNLILDAAGQPIPLGILRNANTDDNPTPGSTSDNSGQVRYYPSNATTIAGTAYSAYAVNNDRPRLHSRALWFKTRNVTNTANPTNPVNSNYGWNFPLWIENIVGLQPSPNQPLLTPVLQIQFPFRNTEANRDASLLNIAEQDIQNRANNWLQVATTTQTNLVFAQGDTPARPNESNGGLENFVRYLEIWAGATHQASGSFIQYKRSSYATAPWYPIVANFTTATGTATTTVAPGFSATGTALGYPQMYRTTVNSQGTFGRTPFYIQPGTRSWGFDVALLTQLPDLFSQRFTAPPTGSPNEFYREVSRDDNWVSTLLCAATESTATPTNYGTAPSTKYGANKKYAIPQDQRPSNGPSRCQ